MSASEATVVRAAVDRGTSAVGLTMAFLMGAAALLPHSAYASESRTYAVSMFSQAANSVDGDCSRGINVPWQQQVARNLADLGYEQKEIAKLARTYANGDENGAHDADVDLIMAYRGRIDGEPVNALAYPATVVDPKLNSVDGKIGYGFNLDGKGAEAPNSFTDPATGETGVDHGLYRALGCTRVFRGTLENLPTYWVYIWGQLVSSQPAWLITIAGENLSKDGQVTVTFDRALRNLRSNADGTPKRDVTYRIDPDPRSHNVFRGKLQDGLIVLSEPGSQDFRMHLNPLLFPEVRLGTFHLRLKLKPDRTLEGIIGGYQPWSDVYGSFAASGSGGEPEVYGDLVGIYYLLKKYADADPDPVTHQNASISAAYYLKAVPALAVPAAPAKAEQVTAR